MELIATVFEMHLLFCVVVLTFCQFLVATACVDSLGAEGVDSLAGEGDLNLQGQDLSHDAAEWTPTTAMTKMVPAAIHRNISSELMTR